MSIEYKFVIRQLTTTKNDTNQDIVSHIHFDYVGTDENNNSSYCQGVIPLQIVDHTFFDPIANKSITIPSILDSNNFIQYDNLTEEIVLSWINTHLPEQAISKFKESISKQIANNYVSKSNLPWK